ncbi:MAG: sensor histidine kinase [Burkholderiaceae bacterium]
MPSDLLVAPAWATLVALLLSTQFLAQPFVWASYPFDEIATAWLAIFRNRSIVTSCIALAVVGTGLIPSSSAPMRALMIALAIAVGALAGEYALGALEYESSGMATRAMFLRVSRWCVIGLAIASIFFLYYRAMRARAEAHGASLRAAQIERQAMESRLQLLRAQIEPHFLFNTLATIRRLHHSEPEQGELMLGNFIDYLRAAIPKSREHVPLLCDELDLGRAYLGLVAVRMSGRLTWSMDVDPSLATHRFPPLSLATLAENAIKHGIVPAERGGHVAIVVRRVASFIEASVIDTGVGLSVATGGSGIGLANTRARLFSLHGPSARLELMHNQPRGVRATIRIPD